MTEALRQSWQKVQKLARQQEEAELRRVVVDPHTIPQHLSVSRLVEAVVSNDAETVQLLLAKGQKVNALHPVLGYSALHAAVDQGHFDMVRMLVEAGADVNLPRALEKKRGSAGHASIKKRAGHNGAAAAGDGAGRLITEFVEKPETSRDTPLHFAALAGRAQIAE
jgi:ankyrin repeat protein